jgi:predicted nucleic acid-binding protein
LVVTEIAYLMASRLGTEAEFRFLAELGRGSFITEPVALSDWPRIAELVWTYRDLPLGTVDASLIACAERLNVGELATLDRGHFLVVRPAHVAAFRLFPE